MPKKKAAPKTKVASKPSEEQIFGVVTYRMTYIWSEMTTRSKILKIIVQGTVLEILEDLPNDWSKVRTVDATPIEGYIRSVFVEKAEG